MEIKNFSVTPLTPNLKGRGFESGKILKRFFWLALVIVAFALAYFFLNPSPPFSSKNVELTIEAPSETVSGEKINYLVKYRNKNDKLLRDARLTFFYPDDSVVIKDGKPNQFLTENIALGNIEPEAEGVLELSAYLAGSRGDMKTAKAILVFSSTEVSSSFKKEASFSAAISAAPVFLDLIAPTQAISGENVSFQLDYRNESSQDLGELRMKFSYPNGFSPTSFKPSPSSGRNTWDILQLRQGEDGRIIIGGILKGREKESKPVTIILQKKIEGIFADFQKASAVTLMSAPPLSASILVNEQTAYSARPGGRLDYQVKFKNNTDADLLNLSATAKLEGSMFDFASLESGGIFNNSNKTIYWDGLANPLLNQLAPGQEGAVSFGIKLMGDFPSGSLGAKDLNLKVTVQIKSPTVPSGFNVDKVSAESELVVPVISK